MRNMFRVTMDYDPKMFGASGEEKDIMMVVMEQLCKIKGADCISVNEDDDCPN